MTRFDRQPSGGESLQVPDRANHWSAITPQPSDIDKNPEHEKSRRATFSEHDARARGQSGILITIDQPPRRSSTLHLQPYRLMARNAFRQAERSHSQKGRDHIRCSKCIKHGTSALNAA